MMNNKKEDKSGRVPYITVIKTGNNSKLTVYVQPPVIKLKQK